MLLSLAARIVEASPSPVPDSGGSGGGGTSFTDLIPLVTGAGGALVVLMLIAYLFLTDRIVSVGAVTRLREADNLRFNDMVDQRDRLTVGLEKANETTAISAANQQSTLDLLHEVMQTAPPKPAKKAAPRRRT
jgi:hypothetical protein